MGAVYGVQATKIATGGIANLCARGTVDARVKTITDYYEASALATSSTIIMGRIIEAGARILDVSLMWDSLNAGALGGYLEVGDKSDMDRYIASTQATTAGAKRCTLVDGIDYVVGTASGDNQIYVSYTGVSAATGTIKLVVTYSSD